MVPGGLLVTSSTTRLTSRDLVGDPGGDPGQHVVGQPGPVGGHGVLAGDRAQHDRVAVGAAVALHADAADVGEQHHRALPDLAVQAGRGELLAGDGVGLAQHRPAVRAVTSPTIRIARPGPGNGWRANDFLGQPELAPDRADLVLEQRPQRLDEFELQVVGQTADVVVALDVGRAVPPPDSTTSGYSVPWTRNSTAVDRADRGLAR